MFLYPFLSYLEYEKDNNILENWAINHSEEFIKVEHWELVDYCFQFREKKVLNNLIRYRKEEEFKHYYNKRKDTEYTIELLYEKIIKYNCESLFHELDKSKIDKNIVANLLIKYGRDWHFDFSNIIIDPNYIIDGILNGHGNFITTTNIIIPSNNEFPEICDTCCSVKELNLIRFFIENNISYPTNDSLIYLSSEPNVIDILNYLKTKNSLLNLNWIKGFIAACSTNQIENIKWYIKNILGVFFSIDDLHNAGIVHAINNKEVYDLLENVMILNDVHMLKYSLFLTRYKASFNELKYIFMKTFYDVKQQYIYDYMMKFIDKSLEQINKIEKYKQRSDEWKKARVGVISGTKTGPFCGHSPYKTPMEELKESLTSTFEGNIYTTWGTYVEPLTEILTRLFIKIKKMKKDKNVVGIDFWEDGFRISEEHPWLGVSSDGHYYILNINGQGERGTIELKAPGRNNSFYEECPHQYYDQFQTASYILKTDEIQFVCFTPSKIQFNYYKFNSNYWFGEIMPTIKRFYFEEYITRLFMKDKGLIIDHQIDPVPTYLLSFAKNNKEMFIEESDKNQFAFDFNLDDFSLPII